MDSNITKWIIDHYGILGIGAIIVIALIVALFYERLKNAVKHDYDKRLIDYTAEKEQQKAKEQDTIRLQVTANMALHRAERIAVVITVKAVNVGKRGCFVGSIGVFLNQTTFRELGGILPPMTSSPDEESNVLNPPKSQLGTVELKPDGGSHTWAFPMYQKHNIRAYPKDGANYGNGQLVLTSGEKFRFEFPLIGDADWNVLTAPVAPVFGGTVGHKCSKCGFTFLMPVESTSVTCPKCHTLDFITKYVAKFGKPVNGKEYDAIKTIHNALLPMLRAWQNCNVLLGDDENEWHQRASEFSEFSETFGKVFDERKIEIADEQLLREILQVANKTREFVSRMGRAIIFQRSYPENREMVKQHMTPIKLLELEIPQLQQALEKKIRSILTGK